MIIVEYRVPMPFSAEEYRIGQLYTIAKKSKLESADAKNGVRINSNEPYSAGPGGSGQYTNKTYYIANKIPDWLKRLIPDSAAKLKEEAWNAYPYSKNKFSNSLLDKLNLEIESYYLDGPPTIENVFKLNEKEEKSRSILLVDLVNDAKYKYSKGGGCKLISAATNQTSTINHNNSHCAASDVLSFNPLFREQLSNNWLEEYESAYNARKQQDNSLISSIIARGNNNNSSNTSNISEIFDNSMTKHLMTCYKLCRVNFPIWPVQNKVEQFLQEYCRDTIIQAHRQAWLWQDEWTGMSLGQIRDMESAAQRDLVEIMRQESLN